MPKSATAVASLVQPINSPLQPAVLNDWLKFSHCAALVDGPRAGEGELDLDTLAAPAIPGLVPALERRRHELLYLTESGPLTPVGRRSWTFAHRIFQEYLAAAFFSTSRISPAVQKELLGVGGGRSRHVVPEHEEVRLAVRDERLFADLLTHDLPVLLLAGLQALPARQRARGPTYCSTAHRGRISTALGGAGWTA